MPIDLPIPPPLAKEGNYEFWFGMEIQGQTPMQIKAVEKISSKTLLSDSVVFHVAGKNKKKRRKSRPPNWSVKGRKKRPWRKRRN